MSSPSGSRIAATGCASSTEDGDSLSVPLANADEVKRPIPAHGAHRRTRSRRLPLAPADHVKRPLAHASEAIRAGIRAATRAPSASSPNPATSISRVAASSRNPLCCPP